MSITNNWNETNLKMKHTYNLGHLILSTKWVKTIYETIAKFPNVTKANQRNSLQSFLFETMPQDKKSDSWPWYDIKPCVRSLLIMFGIQINYVLCYCHQLFLIIDFHCIATNDDLIKWLLNLNTMIQKSHPFIAKAKYN